MSPAYSVLTHEQLVDLSWKDLLVPALMKRFPQTTKADLDAAHAYAYGGCAIQDLGYYPFSHQFFSDLTHYVHSGDFVMNLLRDAQNANEYAFALGALSHYLGDVIGHHDAINPATAIAFPELAKKYGPSIAYDQDPHAHIRTEFAFDIDQLSKQRLAPGAYLRWIGLSVPTRLLAQAFEETYSLPLRDVVGRFRPTTRSYRSSVRSFLPRVAYAETAIHRNEFPAELTNDSLQTYLDYIARADFQTVWKNYRRKPGVRTKLLAVLIRILPKVGVLSDLAIAVPTQATQDLYVKSVNLTIDSYSGLLKELLAGGQLKEPIANRDLDTGEVTKPGAYKLTDKTYLHLLHDITASPQRPIAADLRQDILRFYSDPNANASQEIAKELSVLRNMPDRNSNPR